MPYCTSQRPQSRFADKPCGQAHNEKMVCASRRSPSPPTAITRRHTYASCVEMYIKSYRAFAQFGLDNEFIRSGRPRSIGSWTPGAHQEKPAEGCRRFSHRNFERTSQLSRSTQTTKKVSNEIPVTVELHCDWSRNQRALWRKRATDQKDPPMHI